MNGDEIFILQFFCTSRPSDISKEKANRMSMKEMDLIWIQLSELQAYKGR